MANGARSSKSVDEIVSDAVGLGYKVIDEQIRQGRAAAEQIRSGVYSSSNAEADVKNLMDRVLYLLKELGVVGFDFAAAMMRDPSSYSAGRPSPDFTIQVQSKKRVELNYHLTPAAAAHFEPMIYPLHATDQKVAPLSDIRIEARTGQPVLVVEVPDNQPAATYTAVILDATTKQARGFISVTVLD